MWEWLEGTFGRGFMPHGHCYLWAPEMVWTQVSANVLISIAYAAIAATLAVLVRRVANIPFAWVYLAFGTFILSCGLTHFFDVVTVWHPIYWADAAVRVVTATASVATAVLIVPLVPKAVAFADAAQLSKQRGLQLEAAHLALEKAHERLAERELQAQRRAWTSEEQFRSLVETMPQLTWIADPKGQYLFRNKRWSEYTGLSFEDPADAGWESVYDPDAVERVRRSWADALESQRPFEVEARFRRLDGEYRWFLLRAVALLDEAGDVLAWMGTCTDIHDQRVLQEQALRMAKMKDEFLATISHELRTPLHAILGWSRLLKAGALSEDRAQQALESVERNAVVQARLVDDLLDVSRVISGKMRLDTSLINPATAVEAALDAVRSAAIARGVELSSAIDHEAGRVLADAGRIQQIVWNLAGNAVKFTPRQGRVGVRVARAGSHVQIVVSDSGVGINREYLPHVFERFSQEDGSIRRSSGGLGLGLAITKQLVELHGGDIQVESAGKGQGATFVVRLPLADPLTTSNSPSSPPDSTPPSVSEHAELHGLRLLLVEDDADSREILGAILSDTGIVVTCATSAEQALEVLASTPIDVLVSDVGLPGIDGCTFLRLVRSELALTAPAAALTGHAHAEDHRQALESGFQKYLRKPFKEAELLAVVADLARIAGAAREADGRKS